MPVPKKRRPAPVADSPAHPVIGLEAEFELFVDGVHTRPETYFGTPREFVGRPLIQRSGRSLHLPTGGALYFDTGVLEVATPIIEIEPHCAHRAARSLWEQIAFLRETLDAWEKTRGNGQRLTLTGFSAHYNVSFTPDPATPWRTPERLAYLLCHLLPFPVMLLAANRKSTGIGVRPRGNRLEITADFTPDPDLMTAAASFITAAVREVMSWPDYGLEQLALRGLPRLAGFTPRRHTSRKGWLARHDRFPHNPFTCDPMEKLWRLEDGRVLSLRQVARALARPFRRAVGTLSTPDVSEHVYAVLTGRARSFLDFPERPPEYEDAGRQIRWNRRQKRPLPRSRYEKVIFRVLEGKPLRTPEGVFTPHRMKGWHEVIYRNPATGKTRLFTLDQLALAGD
jgi:hypothetical protein